MKRLLKILMAVVMAVSCGPEQISDPVPETVEGIVTVYGGREKVLCSWTGLSDNVVVIRLTAKGREWEFPVRASSGEKNFNGFSEGRYEGAISYLTTSGIWVDGGKVDINVYGDSFGGSLINKNLEVLSQESVRADVKISGETSEGAVAVIIDYISFDGISRTVRLELDGNKDIEYQIPDLGGDISWRTVYRPSEKFDDEFMSESGLFKNQSHITPETYCETVDGYKGIWFSIGQAKSDYGPKYSGGLGTYTMKHIPMAIYAPEVNRTYFVYGGCPSPKKAYLQCMIGCYDHNTGLLQKPRVVYDKGAFGVSDPHDDPTVQIDRNGYIWVFVAGRGNTRPGRRYRSVNPYDITAFEFINESIMAYPQVMYDKDKGFFLFETRYDGTRQLFFQKSEDGVTWTPYKQLASIKEPGDKNSGHYQISNMYGTKLCTAFNRHKNGNVDTRTNFYFLQSTDWGETFTTASGEPVTIPVTTLNSNCLVHDYQSEGRNCYIKDVNFDTQGNPIVIMVTSDNYLTGPAGGIREWHVWYYDGTKWNDTLMTTSRHCYDSGSIWVKGDEWTIIAPTEPGPTYWGAGGEVVMWKSFDHGKTWKIQYQMTHDSERNHTYMRRPWYCADEFYSFWADGDPNEKTISYLYFCNAQGDVWQMPYEMTEEWAAPIRYN